MQAIIPIRDAPKRERPKLTITSQVSTFRATIFFPGPYIIKLEHRSAPKLTSRLYQAPHECVIVNFDGSHASQATSRFGAVAPYRGINQVVVPGDVPAATGRINAIALISIGVTESIVLNKQELLGSKIGVVSPGPVAMGMAAPSIMVNLKGKCP